MTDQPEPTEVAHQGNRVAVRNYLDADLDGRWRYAQSLAQAGNLLPDAMRDSKSADYSPGRIYLITETGAMLGLHPVAALSSINVIEGKPAISAAGMAGVIRAAGHKLRVSETGTVEGGDYAVTTTLIRSDDPEAPFTSTWTPHRAARAGLCSYTRDADGIWRVVSASQRGNPLPWQLYTESLCKARSMSEVGRDGGQDVLLGVRYTPEELGAVVNESGDVIEATPEPASAEPEQPKRRASRAKVGTQGTRRKVEDEVVVEPEPEAPPAEPDGEPEYTVNAQGEVVYPEGNAWDNEPLAYDATWAFPERLRWLDEFGVDNEQGRQLWLDWQNSSEPFTDADKAALLQAKVKMEERAARNTPAVLA